VSEYSVRVRQDDDHRWAWEISRHPAPLGVRIYEGGHKTPSEARVAGEHHLRELLDSIAKEDGYD
jgi:hypothetical protein